MQEKPLVLIVSRRLTRKNKEVNWVSEAHISMLMQQNLLPVLVPIVKEALGYLHDYKKNMCGLLMVEGGDLQPEYYKKELADDVLDEPDLLKDQIETELFRFAVQNSMPVLGICRGIQIMNVMMGGDLKNLPNKELLHINYDNYDAHRHKVSIVKESPLYDWYQKNELLVNTYHHQGINRLAEGFKPMAYSEDGLIEGIYNDSFPFMVGLQFHPERMLKDYSGNIRVFEEFGKAVYLYSQKKQ